MGQHDDGVRHRTQPQQDKRNLLPHEEPDDPDWPYAHGNLDPMGKFIGLSIMVVSLSLVAYFRYQQYLRDIIITPLDAPPLIPSSASRPGSSPDRFWGTYRPYTYFGLKTRSPNSPVFGSMWLKQFTNTTPPPVRHWCDEDDGLHSYSWLLHDGKSFGIQEVEDEEFTVRTEFVRRAGGQHGGDWTARVTMTPKSTDEDVVVSSMFYVAVDGRGSVQPVLTGNVLTEVLGHTQELGSFQLKFPVARNKNQKDSHLIAYASNLTQLTGVVKTGLNEEAWDVGGCLTYLTLGGQNLSEDSRGINFIVKEMTAVLPLEMEVVFESGSFSTRPDTLAKGVFDTVLRQHVDNFHSEFSDRFKLEKKGFGEIECHMAKVALSNLLGNIGYVYGSSLVQSEYNKVPVNSWTAPLLSSVSSRSLSSHGTLWDAGFQNVIISCWDKSLSLEIIGHWLDLMNTEGWIPRERVFANEACVKIQDHSVVQHNKMAAPPTIFLPLQKLIPSLVGSKDPAEQRYLAALYPRLKAWYAWYNSSHTDRMASVYQWRGHDDKTQIQINPFTIASGLSDYPRASHPTDEERHVDFRCWMALASGVMEELAKSLNKQWQDYTATHQLLTDNALLDRLHWSEEGEQYSDYGLHTDDIKVEKLQPPHLKSDHPVSDRRILASSTSDPNYQFVNAFGYVSLFPFLLKIVDPQSPKLHKILTDLQDPPLLWSQYGVRSLAPTSHFYQLSNTDNDPPSWRGHVWINMNFLTLTALHHYSHVPGPYSHLAGDIYSKLRANLVRNIVREFRKTGKIWERYSDKTGQGIGSQPFTGSSALVVLIMMEIY